jgi:pimeloyl-ACP methyl ester carboxylesterase
MADAKRVPWPVWATLAGLGLMTLVAVACSQAGARRRAVLGPVGQLAVDDGGSGGLPVLFVHSFAGSLAHWQPQLAHLRSRRRAVAMDLRGNGGSDPPRHNDYTITGFADDIAAVADGLGFERFVLVGHSMGGSAAAAYASRHAERVAGLLLVGTPGQSPDEQTKQVMASLESDYDTVMENYWGSLLNGARPEVRSQLMDAMRGVPREAAKAMIGTNFAFDPVPALHAYAGPTLHVDTPHGDSPTSLYRLLPQMPRELITGTSHWPQLDAPEHFNRLLDDYLSRVA